MVELAKREGFMLGHKLGMEHGEAKGERLALEKIDQEIRGNLFKGIEIIVKYGYAVMKYTTENFKAIEILSYKINYLPTQRSASVLFLLKSSVEDEYNFSRVLDIFEGFASKFDNFAIEANFVNVREKEADYQLIQFDYPKSLDIAFVKDAFTTAS